MDKKLLIKQLENRRNELQKKVNSIRITKGSVPPFSAWAKNALEGIGDMFRDYRDDVYINNLKREISAMEDYIRQFG